MTGLTGFKEDYDRVLREQHPSLEKQKLQIADFFSSKESKDGRKAESGLAAESLLK